ncbi:peptidoglycan-binding domain-containing protein [Streptomyces sp. E11-3]|uniref:peptidoglycan-binding domain-containing protein n=1 Tax=Streptomyces sp. E11-3 TaxID=3110112 RepID=UPI0039812761
MEPTDSYGPEGSEGGPGSEGAAGAYGPEGPGGAYGPERPGDAHGSGESPAPYGLDVTAPYELEGVDEGHRVGRAGRAERAGRAGRKRRMGLLAMAGAVVAVVAVTGLASGLFSSDSESESDRVLPDQASSAPATLAPSGSPEPPASASASESASATAEPSSSTSESAEASPSATGSASPSASTRPKPSPTTANTSGAAQDQPPAEVPVLRRGDKGPEVQELQRRLKRVLLYLDEEHGNYNPPTEDAVRNYQLTRQIKGDPSGVYGPATRRALEQETN